MASSFPSDLEIAQRANPLPLADVAAKLGFDATYLEYYGHFKAKLPLDLLRPQIIPQSKLVLVSAITPTPAGEGKTTVSIGLTEGLNRVGKRACVVLREPSLGPVFGMKGGAAGGGYAQVIPMVDINLHFTGDFSVIEKANNLLAALIDNHLHHRPGPPDIDPRTVVWKRVMDMNDRSLRHMVTGLGGKTGGLPREAGFDITAASEVMAILCLSRNRDDLKNKLGNIYIGDTYQGKPVFARDLEAQGAMAALLQDAIKPNLVQTLEGNPAILHGGPFANIAQGTNSLLATYMGMSWSDYVVTEAGFGADLGGEKFFNIKCRYGEISPCATVLTATVRALKYHGGVALADLNQPNAAALERGLANLDKHLENLNRFGVPAVVCINRFASDTEEELDIILRHCRKKGVEAAVGEGFVRGGEGMMELAEAVVRAVERCTQPFRPTYAWEDPLEEKILQIARQIYGAAEVTYSVKARSDLKRIKRLGMDDLPVCMAKTQYSFSDNPKKLGRPEGFELTIREIELAAGAGFVIPIAGDIMRMPGLPKEPAALRMDVDSEGRISGLS
jgi:formate--tetrahydrofolate ligase